MNTLCATCGEDFSGIRMFDNHRTGAYGPGDYKGALEDWQPKLGRRCLTEDEMRERGWALNARGCWQDPTEAARARSSLHRSSQAAA